MASLAEKLANLYGDGSKKELPRESWIPKKQSNDPFRSLKKTLKPETTLSAKRTEDILDYQEAYEQAKQGVLEIVAEYLLATYGERNLENKLVNFQTSWDDQFERFGPDMAEALLELSVENSIVSHEGYIRKAILRDKIKEIVKRRKNQ